MSRLLMRRKIYDAFIIAALFFAVVALLLFPQESMQGVTDGLTLCINVLIPSLFPFFVLSSLMVKLGVAQYFGKILEPVMRPLFNVGGACSSAFVLGFVGGYPVGAKTAISLYENGCIEKDEAERLLAFSNNSGPAFILGVVGVGIFASSRVGLMLYAAHAVASIIVGILFRNWGRRRSKQAVQYGGDNPVREQRQARSFQDVRFSRAFVQSVTGAFQTTLNICAFVIFFTVFIRLLFLAGIIPAAATFLGGVLARLGLDPTWAETLVIGFIELTSGVWSLNAAAGELSSAIAMVAFMLGWAGLSVHCQVLSFIGDSGLSVRSYILGNFLHGGISAVLIFILTRIMPFHTDVASYLVEGVQGIAAMDFGATIRISSFSALFLWTAVLLICLMKRARMRQKRLSN